MTITGKTQVGGVLGNPISHSLSPQMHNAAFEALELDYVYVPFQLEPAQIPGLLTLARSTPFYGLNVTVPYKQTVIPYLDELDQKAQDVGAVNTILNKSGTLLGTNTDADGFLDALAQDLNFSPQGKQATLLGAGGSAAAVAVALIQSGINKLVIANRTAGRAEQLCAHLDTRFQANIETRPLSDAQSAVEASDLIVNTTSVGLDGSPNSPIPIGDWARSGQVCYDIIYSPEKTPFLAAAESRGATILNGRSMLVYQGAHAFQLFTGHAPPIDVMKGQVLPKNAH